MDEKSSVLLKHEVEDGITKTRLCDYIPNKIVGLSSKSGAKKAIKRGELFIDGELASSGSFVEKGNIVEWHKKITTPSKIFKLDYNVIFEDDYLAVINKPAGVVVSGNYYRTIENSLPGKLSASKCADALSSPLAIHRLDRDTCGLLIIAKTQCAHINLSRQMENKQIGKKYQAVVIGAPPYKGSISIPIDGKEALTLYKVLKQYKSLKNGTLSLVELSPKTGRTHQLRKHLLEIGHPILGDKQYYIPNFILKHRGMFLCASELVLSHPQSGKKIQFKIPPPLKFHKFPQKEEDRYYKYSNLGG